MKHILLCLIVLSNLAYASKLPCQGKLLGSRPDGTKAFISYLSLLMDKNFVEVSDVLKLVEATKSGFLLNPISESTAAVNSARMIHRAAIQEILANSHIDTARINSWLLTRLESDIRDEVVREVVFEDTQLTRTKIQFFPIQSGRFLMGEKQPASEVVLTHDFEMMSTPVTQGMWVQIMKENGSAYLDPIHKVVQKINSKSVSFSPDHPVENVTWWSALVFANELSRLNGFKEAYDLSGVDFYPESSAKDGKAIFKSGDVKINAPDGDIYLTEGYRLPTEAEMEFVLQNYFKKFSHSDFDDENDDLKNYFWFNGNSTHPMPVGEMPALVINGNPFYDLLGNISEWTWDYFSHQLGGVNPVSIVNTYNGKVLKGGSWASSGKQISPYYRNVEFADKHGGITGGYNGFRLVRTIQ